MLIDEIKKYRYELKNLMVSKEKFFQIINSLQTLVEQAEIGDKICI